MAEIIPSEVFIIPGTLLLLSFFVPALFLKIARFLLKNHGSLRKRPALALTILFLLLPIPFFVAIRFQWSFGLSILTALSSCLAGSLVSVLAFSTPEETNAG